jgi:hypothetical protein
MGTLDTKFPRLTDVLVYEPQEYLILTACLLLPVHAQADEDVLLPYMQVRRHNILFAVHHPPVARASGPVASPSDSQRLRVPKVPHRVALRVSGWSIEGDLHVPPEAEVKKAMMALGIRGETFVPLTDAIARDLTESRPDVGPDTIIVNRDRIIAFWPLEAGELETGSDLRSGMRV